MFESPDVSPARRSLNGYDLVLVTELQPNGPAPIGEFAKRMGWAESTCHTRLRALDHANVIRSSRAELDAVPLNFQIYALSSICHPHAGGSLREFQRYLVVLAMARQVY